MSPTSLAAISPVVGRYASRCAELRAIFSESGLVRAGVRVEIAWLHALAGPGGLAELGGLGAADLAVHSIINLTLAIFYETIAKTFRRFLMGKKIGYARVSTNGQDLALQVRDLKAAGCRQVFTDRVGGSKNERPGLDACLKTLKKGDSLLVWRLDRLGRSMQHLVNVVADLKGRGVGFKSLRDGAIDTTTASGELVFNIFAALAQFEKELIRERTMAGLSAARARGRLGGRKPVSISDPKVRTAKKIHADKSISIGDICNTLKISRATFYRYLAM